MGHRVHEVRLAGLPLTHPADRPLLIAANHVSWWDGFLVRAVQRALRPQAPLHTVMISSELARFPFFRWMGAVGMDPSSPSSVGHAVRLLERRFSDRPEGVIAFFPQGRVWPSHRRPLGFARGVELFANRLGAVVLPLGLHLEPLNRVAPTAFVAAGQLLPAPVEVGEVERAVEGRLDAILAHLAAHGEDAADRWPAPGLDLDAATAPAGSATRGGR
jgi:1-acyl-sn-glycerol-3-phosphate acyltransferase